MISQLRHEPTTTFEDERILDNAHGESPHDGHHAGRPGRSMSRRSRVENSIEANLTNAEPASHVRSRKSSHYLGLFKENTGSPERKKREDRGRPLDEPSELRNKRLLENQDQKLPGPGPDIPLHATKSVPQLSSLNSPSMDMSYEHGLWHDGKTDGIATYRALPRNLLEEIRNFHLTPGGARGSSFSRSIPTQFVEGGQDYAKSDDELSKPPPSPPLSVPDKPTRRESDPSEEEDEVNEQISSALYFPHERVSVSDEVDQVPTIDKSQSEAAQDHARTPTREEDDASKEYGAADDEQDANHVDISLLSKNDSRIFHGDLQDLNSPLEDQAEPSTVSTTSERDDSTQSEAASTTADESGQSGREEESSLTDDAGITPRATPTQSFMRPRRKHRKAAPIGAVELKPYRHQVGGHTTVFRFSRRAVCKQLNNRENQFYERIERRHPEMLMFLARFVVYIGI